MLKFKLWQSVTRLFWLLPEVLEIYFICFVCDFVFPILVQYSTSWMQVAWEGSCHHCTATPPVRPPLFEALRKCYITSCRKYRIKTGKCSNFENQLDIFCNLKRIFKNGLFNVHLEPDGWHWQACTSSTPETNSGISNFELVNISNFYLNGIDEKVWLWIVMEIG